MRVVSGMTAKKKLSTQEWLATPVHEWLGAEMEGRKVIAWRYHWSARAQEWRYQVVTQGGIHSVKPDGTVVSEGCLNMVEGVTA